jgi:hypothetical protein
VIRLVSLALLVGVGACGDDLTPTGPRPLVADPAVETGCSQPIVGDRARVKVVDCAGELAPGRLAAGRIGDFVLENALVRVIVRGPGQGYYLHGSSGGGIVDAVRATDTGWSEDLIKEIQPAVDLTAGAFDELVITEAGDDGPAELVVRGPATQLELIDAAGTREVPDVIIEHRYRLLPGVAQLELITRTFPLPGSTPTSHDVYDLMFVGGRAPSFIPGHGPATGQISGDFVATAGTTTSYGLVYASDASVIDLAGIRLVQGQSADDAGVVRQLLVGDGSIASITERAWPLRDRPVVSYDIRGPRDTDLVVTDGDGKPVTIARADAADRATIVVPGTGTFFVHAIADGTEPGALVPLSSMAIVERGASGTLAISVRDDLGAPIPARVLIETPNLDRRILWVGASGEMTTRVVPGTHRVSISRGLEYEMFVASMVVVTEGATVPVIANLERVVDTSGWISLDTHLHSELSTDSTLPVDDRLRAVAAEGIEIPVSSDHDMITDYGPVIAELGLSAFLGNLVGSEVSSLIWGHLNGFPLVPRADRTGGGSPSWLARSPGQVFQLIHDGGPDAIVQVNHPRLSSAGLFDAIDLNPVTGTVNATPGDLGLPTGTDLSSLDFDAIEVANAGEEDTFEQVFDDWLKLVENGHPACATGSSDSHGASAYAGEARTFVYVGNDDPSTIDQDTIMSAIRARHVVVGTGAFVTAGVVAGSGTSLPGETVTISGAVVPLHIKVQAASWRQLQRIRIFQGAQEIQSIPLDPQDTSPVRYDQTVNLPAPATDTFYVIRVESTGSGAPVNDNTIPSFTNPIFVDVP